MPHRGGKLQLLMSMIRNNTKTRVTTADIAAHLGIGKSTVTQVLNGRAEEKRISIATRERVQEAARELGYRPNAFARAVGTGRFGCAALIQPRSSIYLPHWLLLGLTEELQKHDMTLMLSEAHDTDSRSPELLPKAVRELAADGLLVNMGGRITETLQVALEGLNTPVVWINRRQEYDAVHPDDILAGRMATEHLLKMGHRRIAYLDTTWPENGEVHYSRRDRVQGYREAMQAKRLEMRLAQLPAMPATIEDVRLDERVDMAAQFLAAQSRATAIVTYGLESALPILQAAERLGLNVPRNLSLVMCADDINRHIGRPVTTVVSSMPQVGSQSVQMLLQRIEEPERSIPSVAIAPWFFEGATCAPPA
jgi:LacI family transcriptional regulator